MKVFFLLICLFSSSLSHAESGWTSYGKVVQLQADSDFRFRVSIDVNDNPSRCRSEQDFFATYVSSGANQIYAGLLEALIHNLQVKVFVSGICGLKGDAEISAISLKR
jgi:hypothetical protein